MMSSFKNENQLSADQWVTAWNLWFRREGAKFLNKYMKIIQLH